MTLVRIDVAYETYWIPARKVCAVVESWDQEDKVEIHLETGRVYKVMPVDDEEYEELAQRITQDLEEALNES